MKLPTRMTLAMCLGLLATSTQALDHEVFITKKGYFPETLYITSGDRFVFRNISGKTATLDHTVQTCGWESYYYYGWRSRWVCNNQSVSIFSISNNNSQTVSLTTELLALISGANSKIPAPKLNGSTASNSADISYATAPTSCPDTRVLC